MIEKTTNRIVKWGELGYITYARTYSRLKNNGKKETFSETVERELYGIDKQLKLKLSEDEKEFYRDMRHNMEGTVAGRFTWQLGTKTVDKLGLASLQNCSFVIIDSPVTPFTWAYEMLMLGSGVGFSVKKEHIYQLPKITKNKIHIIRQDDASADFIVPDTREGWVKLLGKILKAYFYSGKGFTYSTQLIRGKGAPIKGFGGVASGAEEMVKGLTNIVRILDKKRGSKLKPIDALDIMNIIGSIVVSGNVRRSAQIAIGDYDDVEFLKAKRWDLGNIPNWRVMSNNSVDCPDINLLPQEFWDSYYQGEPIGLVNIELAKKIGRLGDYKYADNCEGFNPCQPKYATLLTPQGIRTLGELNIGDIVWSGSEWTSITNKWSTGIKSVYKYYTSTGYFLGTKNHKVVENGSKVEVKDADSIDWSVGDSSILGNEFDISTIIDGLLIGDGTIHKASNNLILLVIGNNDKDYFTSEIADYIGRHRIGIKEKCWEISNHTITHNELPKTYNRVVPDRFFFGDEKLKRSFLRGLFSANGSVVGGRITLKQSSRILIEQVREMLSSLGIHSYITTNKPKMVTFYNGEYQCKESYDLNITSGKDLFKNYIGFIQDYKNAKITDSNNPKYLTSKISNIEYIGDEEVFDITVNNSNHTYWTGGVLVSNCAEQPLANRETCCLAEVFLPNIKDYKRFVDVVKILYKINKHSLLIGAHDDDTDAIVKQNLRMGIGITGIMMCSKEQLDWLSPCYEELRAFDEEYSRELGVPISIKLTTTKPSGTLSLLAGVTPGVHPSPAGNYYIRRIRIAANSELIDVCRNNGYVVEYQKNLDGTDDRGTFVVEFPCKFPENTKTAMDMDVIEQLEMVKFVQKNWSDNAVSVTAYYKIEDLDRIKAYLKENWQESFKSLSFLLYTGHGFVQAPYEPITKEKYEELIAKVTPIVSVDINEDDVDIAECDNGACPIK